MKWTKSDTELFDTLGKEEITYTDKEFLSNLADWIYKYTGNVNVSQKLRIISNET